MNWHLMKKTRHSVLFVVLLFLAIPHSSADLVLTDALMKDISQAYGFWLGQEYTLDEISKKFPSLSRQVLIARMAFSSEFRSSIEGINSYMNEKNRDEWENLKNTITGKFENILDIDVLSEVEANAFVEEVRQRAKGSIESPVLETLLTFKAGYAANPGKEFSDGYKYKYSHDGSGKAKGVPFTIELPKTWLAKDGDRPNVVQKFISKNGRGYEIVMVLINNIPLEQGERITEKDVDEILNPIDIRDMIPDGATATDFGKLVIETLPGFWVKMKIQSARVRNSMKAESVMYAIFYEDRMIQIQAQVINSINGESIGDGGFVKFEPLFDLIANSLVISSLYVN